MTQRKSQPRDYSLPLINKERSGTRNDAACEQIAAIAPSGMNTPRPGNIMLQYCQNPACSKVERILLAYPNTTQPDLPEVRLAHTIARALGIGVTIYVHAPRDTHLSKPVVEHRHDFDASGNLVRLVHHTTWNGPTSAIQRMWDDHKEHVAGSTDRRCHPNEYITLRDGKKRLTYVDELNKVTYTQGKGNNDLTLSNAVRAVPGVRNIDLDQMLTCSDCGTIQAVIETSTDGAPDSKWSGNAKSARMTQRVAAAMGAEAILLQHSPAKQCGKSRIKVTHWYANDLYNRPASVRVMQWADFTDLLNQMESDHYDICPAR